MPVSLSMYFQTLVLSIRWVMTITLHQCVCPYSYTRVLELVLVAIISNCNMLIMILQWVNVFACFFCSRYTKWALLSHVISLLLPLFIIQAMAMPMPVTLPMDLQSPVLSIWLVMTVTICQHSIHCSSKSLFPATVHDTYDLMIHWPSKSLFPATVAWH